MRILITGGAGFVGASLAKRFKEEDSKNTVLAFDNLHRRGSELNLAEFKKRGIDFHHGDIRLRSDLEDIQGEFDLFIEASAEPSVQAGVSGSPSYVLDTNLQGTVQCLEFARRRVGQMLFLSTSRVYSVEPLRQIKLTETADRFEIAKEQSLLGVNETGITEEFPTHSARSFYGATKFASEVLIQEYVAAYGMKIIIDRCGVIAGEGQFGKVDQGIYTYWVAHHIFKKPLTYTGFKGLGKQVRDVFHPEDLYSLIKLQLPKMGTHSGQVFNIGGGRANSASLRELTRIVQEVTGQEVPIGSDPKTNSVDVPLYVTDYAKAQLEFQWKPKKSVLEIVKVISEWIRTNETFLRPIFS